MDCRVLPHLVADGPAQMALDHALLDAVDRAPTSAYFRTYQWSRPTLSLGYFQSYQEVRADPRWHGVDVVRRLSGGGALWHSGDITYALVVPRHHAAARHPATLYRAIHAAIAGLLAEAGVPGRRRGETRPPRPERDRPFLCFTDADPEDIVMLGRKLVGSAQRRRPSAVLQHGSLVLETSARTPEIPGLREMDGGRLSVLEWSRRFAGRVPEALGLAAHDGEISVEIARDAATLAEGTYADDDWTRRR